MEVVREKESVVKSCPQNKIVILIDDDGTMSVDGGSYLPTAGTFSKIKRVLERWFRVSRRNYRVEQNRKEGIKNG